MNAIPWQVNSFGEITANIPIKIHGGIEDGNYDIHIIRRPHYCDRGDWNILVDGHNDLDYSDGFPRYFFGTEEEVKKQMETWLNKRAAYQEMLAQKQKASDHSAQPVPA